MYLCFQSAEKKFFPGSPPGLWRHNEVWPPDFGRSQEGQIWRLMWPPNVARYFKWVQTWTDVRYWWYEDFGQILWISDIVTSFCDVKCGKIVGDVRDDVINSDVINFWRHGWPEGCHVRFFWKFGPNLVMVPSSVHIGSSGVIFGRGGWKGPPPRMWELKKSPDQIGLIQRWSQTEPSSLFKRLSQTEQSGLI